ncbi:MAG: patatin-like phospholipase family protein [Thermodesulfobacteriota bacterium]
MSIQFRNLVFEGGGVKGIAYVGAMTVLEQRGALAHVRRAGGTSAGAINALLYALGYTIPEQLELLSDTPFKQFMDDSFGVIRDIRRLAKEFGWYQGDFFSTWVGDLIGKKLGKPTATFDDLKAAKRPDLYVVGTNLSTGWAEVFSAERHGAMPLAEAVRISMSIPLFFAAVRRPPRDDVYVDGGVVLNYPVKLFDREKYVDRTAEDYAARPTEYYNRENARFALELPGRSPYVYNRQTLGLRLDTREEIALFRYEEEPRGKPIRKFTEYARALIGAFMRVQENQHLHGDDWQRTLHIDTLDVGTTDFDLSAAKKDELVRSGIDCAEAYFRWFEDPAEQPVNRVG